MAALALVWAEVVALGELVVAGLVRLFLRLARCLAAKTSTFSGDSSLIVTIFSLSLCGPMRWGQHG